MNGSDASMGKRPFRTPPVRRATWETGLIGCAILALGFTAGLPAASAEAQGLRSWAWHADEGPPPIPPGNIGRPAVWHAAPPPPSAMAPAPATPIPVSLAEIRRRAEVAGLHLLGTPHRQGRVYIAFGEDSKGLLHHLTFDAYEGTLVENEATGVAAKPSPAAHPSRRRSAARRTQPAPAGPRRPPPRRRLPTRPRLAPAPDTVTARELSPIKPQPGVKHTPTVPDSAIDKD